MYDICPLQSTDADGLNFVVRSQMRFANLRLKLQPSAAIIIVELNACECCDESILSCKLYTYYIPFIVQCIEKSTSRVPLSALPRQPRAVTRKTATSVKFGP